MSEDPINRLVKIGFSEYEAKAYIALTEIGFWIMNGLRKIVFEEEMCRTRRP